MLPLIKPATFSVALIVFINAWNKYIYALTFMTNDRMRKVPLIIVVLIFQKKIIADLTTGGVKE